MTEQHLTFNVIGNKERLVDRVVNEIQGMILNQKLAIGSKLPTERELAEQLGVSRTVIREAIQTLVARGLLVSKRKIGTIVRPVDHGLFTEPLNLLLKTKGFTLNDLHQVRSILEVEIVALDAEKATQADIDRLERSVVRIEASQENPLAYAEADAEYHHLLAETTGNALLVMLADSVASLLREVRLSIASAPRLFTSAAADHRRILEQIADHNPQKAQAAMRAHLRNARMIQDQFLALENNDGPAD